MGLTWNYQQQTKFLILWGCHASAAIVTEQLNQIKISAEPEQNFINVSTHSILASTFYNMYVI